MPPQPPRRRRIDRVVADDYLDGLAERSTAEVRAMRDECREEESRLSYARRLLHGQLDIVRAESARRGGADDDSLVESLSKILADGPRGAGAPPRSAARTQVYVPTGPLGRRQGDRVLDDMPLGRLPDLSDDELAEVLAHLTGEESAISRLRRTVLDHLDRLQEELVSRYRAGGASVDEAVAGATRQAGAE